MVELNPVKAAKTMLTDADIQQLDSIFSNNVPKENVNDVEHTTVRISEARNEPVEFGNNKFHALDQSVECQIFWAITLNEDVVPVELTVTRLFEQAGWTIRRAEPHTIDPDTGQLTKTFYFDRYIQLKED